MILHFAHMMCVTDENGTRFFTRISDFVQYDTKQSEGF